MGGAHRNRDEHSERPLILEPAGPVRKKGPGPRHKIRVDPFGSKNAAEGGGVYVVEAPFYVKKERGDLSTSHLEGPHHVGEGGDRV